MYIKVVVLRIIGLFFGLFFFIANVFGQNSYNIAIDSVKVLKNQGSIKCGQIHSLAIFWKITSSNTSMDYPTCATGALVQVSISAGSFVNVVGGYSNKLEWEIFDGDYYGTQTAKIPLGSYRDTIKFLTPTNAGTVFVCAAAVVGSSGTKLPDCPANTQTNAIGGLDDYKSTIDTVGSCSALPVSLAAFNIQNIGDDVEITWESIIENNFANYNVEHATNAIDFNEVAYQPGTGNGSRYKYLHTSPSAGLNYYRLKMKDLDGTFVYSDVKVIDFSTYRNSQFNIYPNPFSQVFTVANLQRPAIISIYDLTGKLIQKRNVSDNHLLFDLSQYPSGIYSVIVKDEFASEVFRLIKAE